MQETGRSAISRKRGLGRARWLGAGLAVTVVALGAGLAATALPAYADVTSSDYTIGTPTGAVTAIAATPAAVTTGGVHPVQGHVHDTGGSGWEQRQLGHRYAL